MCFVSPEARVNEAEKVLNNEFFFVDAIVNEAERDWVYATPLLRSTAIATQGELVVRHSVFGTEVLPVLSNPELVTFWPPFPAET